MDAQRWQEVCRAFDDIVELDEVQRMERLARLAVSDAELHASVQTLLRYDATADGNLGLLRDVPQLATTSRDPLALTGRTIAHFRIIEPLAAGGMGVVYRAEDVQLGREVALKLPLPGELGNTTARARFLREGRAAGRLDHPNICQIYEVGESDDGYLYIAMVLYRGETLRERLERETSLSVVEALRIAQQITKGLQAAHDAGVIHRDLKPANVMIMADGGVRILDFGLARAHDDTQSRSSITMGTASYMAPEQARGARIDARADLWSLGVVLYEMLAGRRPFAGDHAVAVVHAILNDEPPPLRPLRTDVPWRLDALVQRLLRKPAGERPATATAVDEELAAIVSGVRAPLRTRLRATLARVARGRELVMMLGASACVTALGIVAVVTDRQAAATVVSSELARKRGTKDDYAWEFYQRATSYTEREPIDGANLRIAIDQYEQALVHDSSFALARARLSIAIFRLYAGRTPRDSFQLNRARLEGERALRTEPNLPEGHLARGYVLSERAEWDDAIGEFQLAAAGMPTSSEPVNQLALVYRMRGKLQEASRYYERAAAIELNVGTLFQLAMTYGRMRRYADAVRTWNRLILLEPDVHSHPIVRGYVYTRWQGNADSLEVAIHRTPLFWNPGGVMTLARVLLARYRRTPAEGLKVLDDQRLSVMEDTWLYLPRDVVRGQLYADLGDTTRARESFRAAIAPLERALSARPFDLRIRTALGQAFAGAGQRAPALSIARALVESAGKAPIYSNASVTLIGAAEIYTRAGAATEAIALLDQLLDRSAGREASVPILRLDPTWDPLRKDPRFEQMLQRKRAPVE